MAVTPTTQHPAPPVLPSPIPSTGRFSKNTLLIAEVVSAVASIALAIFEMITWNTAVSVVASLAVCYAISYFLPEPGAAPAPITTTTSLPGTTPAPTTTPLPPTTTTSETPNPSFAPVVTLTEIIQRATGTPQRLNASLQQDAVVTSDDDSDDVPSSSNPNISGLIAANPSLLTENPHTPENSPPPSPTTGHRGATTTSSTPLPPSTPPQVGRVKSAVANLNATFPSPLRPLQPTDHTIWRREMVALYNSYVELVRTIETFLANSAIPTAPVDRQHAAGVLKNALQNKEREIIQKLAQKRTFISRDDYRRYTSELQVDIGALKHRLDQA